MTLRRAGPVICPLWRSWLSSCGRDTPGTRWKRSCGTSWQGSAAAGGGADWGRSLGCREFASDCSLNNTGSIDFHEKTGFAIENRIVCFPKRL